MDIPADAFEVIVGNRDYEVSDLISAGDKIYFHINDREAIEGYIDDIDLEYNISSNDIRITGRDEVAKILDNDAYPKTYNSTSLKSYAGKILPKYGIDFYCSSTSKFKKIVVEAGENEYSIIERLCKDRSLIPIYDISQHRLELTKPISTTKYSYYFSNTSSNAIKILNADITISNDIKNEVIVYGGDTNSKGKKKKRAKGSYKDTGLKTDKRRILNDSEIEKDSDAYKRAKKEFYDANKNALVVKITTQTKSPIYINRCALVYIKKIDFRGYLLVDSVVYTKDAESGTYAWN
jgi:prophage tail gpP-like protein